MKLENMFNQFPLIESNEITLKKIDERNLNDLFAIYNNKKVFEFCGILPKHNLKIVSNMIGHFERGYNKKSRVKFGVFLNNKNETMVGIIEVMDFKKKVSMATVGYYLAEEYWGNGLATEAVSVLVKYLFETVELNRVHAEVMLENEGSKRVLLKNGFSKEGTIRQAAFWPGKGVVDLEIYGIIREDYIK